MKHKYRIDELAFRIVCGIIAEEVRWSQFGGLTPRLDASPRLSAMADELGKRVESFCNDGTVDVDGDDKFMFTHDDYGHPSPNIEADDLLGVRVVIEFARVYSSIVFDKFVVGTRRSTPRPVNGDKDREVMR